jgi:hypothetical protein
MQTTYQYDPGNRLTTMEGKGAITDIEGLAYVKGTCLDYREDPAR